MPFVPNHLTVDEVEATYQETLVEIERQELRCWLVRLQDPAREMGLAEITRRREAIERDLEQSRAVWRANRPPGDGDAV